MDKFELNIKITQEMIDVSTYSQTVFIPGKYIVEFKAGNVKDYIHLNSIDITVKELYELISKQTSRRII